MYLPWGSLLGLCLPVSLGFAVQGLSLGLGPARALVTEILGSGFYIPYRPYSYRVLVT